MITKRCPTCQLVLPVDAFGLVAKRSDGRAARCRDCERERQRALYHGAERRNPDFLKLLRLGADNTDWMSAGACRHPDIDPDTFFADGRGTDVHCYDEARRICNGCPVREECLSYAFRHSIVHGVWGGLSPRERRQLAKTRRRMGLGVVA